MIKTVGRRVDYDPHSKDDYPQEVLTEGDYGKDEDGCWWAYAPLDGCLGCLEQHEVTEHDDGTISVAPSILISTYDGERVIQWHGYLECGIWREC